MSRGARWRLLVGLAIAALALVLRLLQLLSTGQAVAVGAACEALDWMLALAAVREAATTFRRQRLAGTDPVESFEAAVRSVVGRRLATIMTLLLRLDLPLIEWVFRRRAADSDRQDYRYDGPVRIKLWPAFASSAIAVVVVQLVIFTFVHGWLAWLPLIAGRLLPFYLLIVLAGWTRRPHSLADDVVVLRRAALTQATFPIEDVQRIEVDERHAGHRGGWHRLTDMTYELPVSGKTNAVVYLRPGTHVRLTRLNHTDVPAEAIYFFADQPQQMATALTAATGRRAPRSLPDIVRPDRTGEKLHEQVN